MTNKQIRVARRKLKLTQVKFAARLGVTSNTVARWERGETVPSGMPVIEKLLALNNS